MVIGAGFAGLGAAIELVAAGHDDVVVLEAADEVGGTWRDNTYPGCACDIPSHLYSFSFEPNPDWTRAYPRQPEIQAYLQRTTDRHDLRRRIRFATTVTEMVWDDHDGTWAVHTADGEVLVADVVLNGTGPLSQPHVPELPGLGDFEGTVFHSARWDHAHDLTGERVAVVGTGASAVQFVPEIAPVASLVTVFQRTAPWVVGREDRPVPGWKRRLYRRVPVLQRLHRWRIYARQELLVLAFLGHPRVTDRVRRMGTEHIAESIHDPSLRAAVTPTITPGCKRLLISDDWYPTLARSDVELVTDPIQQVTATGVRTVDGVDHPADTLILGTGFAATDFLAPMRVVGRGGVELSEAWRDGAATHLGITVAGFPNLFLLAGPSTGLGHNSIVFMIEAQLHHAVTALDHLRRADADVVEVRADVQAEAYADVQRRMRGTVWASGCDSWYRSADGRVDTLWPGSTLSYWWRTRRFDPGAHEVRRAGPGAVGARSADSETVARDG
ncbi:flavin-containing monooxygenase [Rhabdothermincola salaria]|uniref:flavin-containing monooxygenase n=1 Tax=Rhabdothermincola salaria TaxID=2903142 RepID=UPI001E5A998D|nr:NAD(P)/FAD-dependent oxidoreductase [Rhabdothermincola salaria]